MWLKVNKLSLNVSKTHYIIFTRKKKTGNALNIRIENQIIHEVYKTKFLGVIIDKKLTWKDHILYISNKISRGIGMIIKAKKRLNKNALVCLYYSFIYPYITYCNHIRGTAPVSSLNKIVVLQKRAIRIICNVNRRASTDVLFRELRIIPFLDVNVYLGPVPLRLFSNVMTLHLHNVNVNKMSTLLKLRPTNTGDIVMTFSLGNQCIQTFHWMRLFSHTLLL